MKTVTLAARKFRWKMIRLRFRETAAQHLRQAQFAILKDGGVFC
jgi:hypothetical protein